MMVTGGAGFIGSTLVDRLLAEGHEVDVVDDLSSGSLANLAEARAAGGRALSIHHLDVRAPETAALIARRRPAVIFHLAARDDGPASIADPVGDADVNVLGSLRVLEGARTAGTERVVFAASGSSLYGEADVADLPIRESHPHRPLSPCGVSKKAVIDYLVAYRELHALEFSALALGNVYGPRQNPLRGAGAVAVFADALVTGSPVTVFGDGEQTRDFVYVDDVVDAFARAATRGGGLVCNVGTGTETTVNALLATLSALVGVEPEIRYAPQRQGEQRRYALDPTRAAIHLGWRPWTALETGSALVVAEARRRAGTATMPR
jgi:UDP-glucose 4-epimerase